jgi:hypothetical protein
MSPHSTFKSKLSFPFTPQEEPLVSLLTLVMVLPTLFLSMKVTPFPMLSKESILPEEQLPTGSLKSSWK